MPSSRRFRIGVDFHTWDGIFQGSRSHVLGLYKQAIGLAPELDFVFFLEGTASLAASHLEFLAPNVTLARMRHAPGPVRLGLQLPWMQLRHRLDLLHMQYRLPLLRLGACASTMHDVLFETHPQFFSPSFVWQSKLTYRQAARRADLLFSVSRYSAGEIARCYGVDSARIHITPNGVDRRRFFPGQEGAAAVAALGLQPHGYLLSVGRLEPRKNQELLVRAYAALGPDAPPLVLVGQRDFGYGGVFAAIESLSLQTRVRVIERLSDNELPAVLRHARAFVYPAVAEGFGMPVAEAMASGVPVITSNTTSLPEVAGEAALLVDPQDAAGWTAAMRRVLDDGGDAGLCRQMVEKGLGQAEQFDWTRSAQVFVDQVRAFLSRNTTGVSAPAGRQGGH